MPVTLIRTLLVAMAVMVAISGCARRTVAPIDDRRPGAPSPAPVPSPVAKPAPAPIPAPAPVPAEPEVVVKPAVPPSRIETRPIGAEPAPPAAQRPSVAAKTEPRAFKVPYSDENLASVQRGEDPRRTAKPGAPTPPDATAAAKPEAPSVKPEAPATKPDAPTVPPVAAGGDAETVDWAWPAAGRVVERFESNSKGLAIGGKVGESVLAAAGGRVVYSGSGLRGYGQLVIIKHNDTYLSAYAHNSRILVKEGQTVTKGQKIAEIGSTDTDRPKLHFEIRRSGKPVDPLAHLPSR